MVHIYQPAKFYFNLLFNVYLKKIPINGFNEVVLSFQFYDIVIKLINLCIENTKLCEVYQFDLNFCQTNIQIYLSMNHLYLKVKY